ncbi:MAG: chromosome partitioning protein ParA, partial [Planctomycetota bacterium]
QPHYLALHGLSKLLHTIELVRRRLNDRLRLAGIVLSLYDSATRLAAEVSADVAVFLADGPEPQPAWRQARLFETRIRRNVRLAEAPSFEQSIFRYAPNSAGADDYRALAAEVLALYAAGSAPAAAA